MLLDNADCYLGNEVLDGLLKAREKAGHSDPLLVVATAGRRPELLARRRRARPVRSVSGVLARRAAVPARTGRRRVARRAVARPQPPRGEPAGGGGADGYGPRVVMPPVDDAVQWLGWLVHELTRGQPAAVDRVLASLRDFDGGVAWDERLRRVFAPPGTLVEDTLGDLLPRDMGNALRAALTRSAAAVNLGQAGATHELWEGASPRCGPSSPSSPVTRCARCSSRAGWRGRCGRWGGGSGGGGAGRTGTWSSTPRRSTRRCGSCCCASSR
ncbi:hypothetical protein NKH77_37770 [Streptomyces sp. M19]